MSRIAKAAQIWSTTCALALFIAPAAFGFGREVITHAPTPETRAPQIYVPTRRTPDAQTGLRGGGDARGKRPVDKRNKPDSAIAKFRLHPIPDTSVGAIYQAILAGGDDALFAAIMAAYEAAITAAEQALTIASQCVVDPSLPECASAESVPQAQQNLSDAQNALATQGKDFYSDMLYLLSLLAFVESPPTSGDIEAEMGAVEAAIQECLASPSTCDATIAQLNAVLAELGVPATIWVLGVFGPYTMQILETPAEAASQFGPLTASDEPLSHWLAVWVAGWCQTCS